MCVVALWSARKYLIAVFRHVIGGGQLDESGELMSYRSAFLGLLIGSAFVIIFCHLAGMSMWFILVFYGLYSPDAVCKEAVSMRCTRCGHENAEAREFCAECGAPGDGGLR